ncbi:MAG: hypothetical protein DRN03_06045, partial [Thermoplasmata archaeon]
MRIKARVISRGYAEGEAIVSRSKISFLGDIDPKTGEVVGNVDVAGENIAEKVF